jgi:hypothetical protein
MDGKMFGLISAVIYFVGGAVCLFGDAMGGTRWLQAGIGLYMVGRGFQQFPLEFLPTTPPREG